MNYRIARKILKNEERVPSPWCYPRWLEKPATMRHSDQQLNTADVRCLRQERNAERRAQVRAINRRARRFK